MPTVMPNNEALQLSRSRVAVEQVNIASAVSRLKNAMGELEEIFINRTEEIAAITLAIASGQHILFEGPAGVAKSDLARECFLRITGTDLCIYDKMFGKGTKEDDVFGPVNMTAYREKAEWTHNIKGSLAACHFANLEELGRASDLLLPSMMTVLNERLFHNGTQVVKCPLITAVASTNFLTESDELAAFNDRWLIRIALKPLDSNQKCIDMVQRSLKPRIKPGKNVITLTEILAINQAVAAMQPEPEVVPLYVDLVKQYMKSVTNPGLQISDRRLVHAFKLAKAAALLEEHATVTADDLELVKYGITICGRDDESVYSTVLQRVVGNATAMKKETKDVRLMKAFLAKVQDAYDPTNDTKVLKELRGSLEKLVAGMRVRSDPILIPDNQRAFNEILQRAEELKEQIESNLNNR